MKIVNVKILIFIFSLLVISCTNMQSCQEEDNFILQSGYEDHFKWEIRYQERSYDYTDLIPVSLKISRDDYKAFPYTQLEQTEIWGDFRLYSCHYSESGMELLFQPVKTGPSRLFIPLQPGLTGGKVLDIKPVNLEVVSVLDSDDKEPAPLIEIAPDGSTSLPIVVLAAALFFIITTAAVLLLKRKKQTPEKEETLKGYLSNVESANITEMELVDHFRCIYRLLLKELYEIHPGVLISDSPSELKDHLETPSPLNQWALRSLYPVLDTMSVLFFSSPSGHDAARIETDLKVLKEWIKYTESPTGQVKK